MLGMGWVFTGLIVLVIGFAVLAAMGRLGQLAPQVDDRPVPDLPGDRPLSAADLTQLRFAVVTRGYSMEQVDAFVDRVGREFAAAAVVAEPAVSERRILPDRLGPVPIGWPAIV